MCTTHSGKTYGRPCEAGSPDAQLLSICRDVQGGMQLGADEAAAWSNNASAWVDAMHLRFPDYRDLLQPVALAIREVRHLE